MPDSLIQNTGALFGDLWHRYDDKLFEESVSLFSVRFQANGFNLDWLRGKQCLDAGCGGGRYTIAIGRLGARLVVGCDISFAGLVDARQRAAGMSNVVFEQTSVLDLPYSTASFDFVCSSGVLHHTGDPGKGLGELSRVLRPGGKLYLLLYGEGGIRWPTIMRIRPYVQAIGYPLVDEAMHVANLPANKQRTFLDDFFVPLIRFYNWGEVQDLLGKHHFRQIERWEKAQLDHESSVAVQEAELEQLRNLFQTTAQQSEPRFLSVREQAQRALNAIDVALLELHEVEAAFSAGQMGEQERRERVFGWGHHRVLAVKG